MKVYSQLGVVVSLILISWMGDVKCQSVCGGGKYLVVATSSCMSCPGNTYCLPTEDCLNACMACPINTLANANRTNCDSGSCQICPIGSYCGGGINILGCPVGTYGGAVGLTDVNKCTDCVPGAFSSTTNQSACMYCSMGTYVAQAKATSCALCSAGTYQSGSGFTLCNLCGKGTYSPLIGSSNTDCAQCVAGSYATGTGFIALANCTLCWQGTYATGSGLVAETNCTACPKGTFSTGLGIKNVSVCGLCAPGTYQGSTSSISCIACEKGTYLGGSGATNASQCTYCPSGSYTVSSSSTSISQCLCNAGYYGRNGGPCATCSPGSYSTNTNTSKCTLCPLDTYDYVGVAVPRDTIDNCYAVPDNGYAPMGSVDWFCFAGYYKRKAVYDECPPCAINTYSNINYTACTTCFNEKTAAATSVGISSCICDAGYYKSSNTSTCVICPIGSYCIGGREDSKPVVCATGRNTTGLGSSNYTNCICQAGWYGPALAQACTVCETGYWCPGGNDVHTACPQNTNSPTSSYQITHCSCIPGYKPHGNISQGTNGTNCTICPTTGYCQSGILSLCRNNSVARVSGATGQEQCDCNPGFYSDTTISICIICPQDTYCSGGLNKTLCIGNASTYGSKQQSLITSCSCNMGYYGSAYSAPNTCTECPV